MKKKIYDLNYSEIINLMKEIIKKPFGRQYFMLVAFVVGIAIVSVFTFIFCIVIQLLKEAQVNYTLLLVGILLNFLLLVMSLFAKMRWMNLIKEYYENK